MTEKKIENIDEIMFEEKDMKRSRLHKHQYIEWLKKRKNNQVNKRYIYYPDQMRRNMEIKNVFLNIDKDGSKRLDMDEIYDMFHLYNFNIQKDDLEKLFKVVDEDQDNALNWHEFKKCALDDEANTVFTDMMRKLREVEDAKQNSNAKNANKTNNNNQPNNNKDSKIDYLPMSFGNMISFLSYCSSRDEMKQNIIQKDLPIIDRYQKIQDLFKLTDEYQQHQQQMSSNPNLSSIKKNLQIDNFLEGKNIFQSKRQQDLNKFFDKLHKDREKKSQQLKQQQSQQLNINKEVIILTNDKLHQNQKPQNEQDNMFGDTHYQQQKQQQQNFKNKKNQSLDILKTQPFSKNIMVAQKPQVFQKRTNLSQNLKQLNSDLHNRQINTEGSNLLSSQFSLNRNNVIEQKKMQKLSQLRNDVENYVSLAKNKYGIDLSEAKLDQFYKKEENVISNQLKDQLIENQPQFKLFSQNISEITSINIKKPNKKKFQEPKMPIATNLKHTNQIPYDLQKDINTFKKIDKQKLYKTVGHNFYTKFISTPFSINDFNNFKYNQKTHANNSIISPLDSPKKSPSYKQISEHDTVKEKDLKNTKNQQLKCMSSTQQSFGTTDLVSKQNSQQFDKVNFTKPNLRSGSNIISESTTQKEFYETQEGMMYSSRSKPFVDSRKQARRLFGSSQHSLNQNQNNNKNLNSSDEQLQKQTQKDSQQQQQSQNNIQINSKGSKLNNLQQHKKNQSENLIQAQNKNNDKNINYLNGQTNKNTESVDNDNNIQVSNKI